MFGKQDVTTLAATFDPQRASIAGIPNLVRRLSDLRGCFVDSTAYENALAADNPVIYSLTSMNDFNGEGQLHYSLCQLMPGRIGDEYFLTRGHLHTWRTAAEIYIGFAGEGYILLEHETTGESQMLPFAANTTIYVPGQTAHRTVNTGAEPLVYMGIYPAQAGHDYTSIADKNFRNIIVAVDDQPTLIDRQTYIAERLSRRASLA